MHKLRWGILGTAKIARDWVIPAIQASDANQVIAVASRNFANAQAFARDWRIATAYGSYEELLADSNVDAVYIPLPNHLHVPMAVKALAAGKHVLCEKPLALNANDARVLLEASHQSPHLLAMEAFMYRFHPQWKKVRQWVEEQALGEMRSVHVQFTYPRIDPNNIRNRPEWGGGGLLDIGSYCVSVARLLFDAEPRRVCATLGLHPEYGVDVVASGILVFAEGNATFSCATEAEFSQCVVATGEYGTIHIERPFVRQGEEPSRVILTRNGIVDELEFDGDHYLDMFDAFAQAIVNQTSVPLPLTDSMANMRVIDAVFASADLGRWVELEP